MSPRGVTRAAMERRIQTLEKDLEQALIERRSAQDLAGNLAIRKQAAVHERDWLRDYVPRLRGAVARYLSAAAELHTTLEEE